MKRSAAIFRHIFFSDWEANTIRLRVILFGYTVVFKAMSSDSTRYLFIYVYKMAGKKGSPGIAVNK
jgi:hypothetical protein